MSDAFKLNFSQESSNSSDSEIPNYGERIFPFAKSEVRFATIQSATKLSKKSVYNLSLDTQGFTQDFLPGDTIGIIPANNKAIVNSLFEHLQISNLADQEYIIEGVKIPKHIPIKNTLRNTFLHNVDLQTPLKKLFLKALSKFVSNPLELSELEKISSPKGTLEYNAFITNEGKDFLGFLRKFQSCKPTIEVVLQYLPPLQPRIYSVCSSSLIPSKVEITFNVVWKNEQTKGLCSGFLEDLIISNKKKVPFYWRQSNDFRLSPELSKPIILIGTGTGIAPFRGILQHLSLQKKTPKVWLFFGCCSKEDFLYENEIEDYLHQGILTKKNIAFSRENKEEKVYVQHLIRDSEEFLNWILQKEATLFICGSQKMIKDVETMVKTIIYQRMDEEKAENYFKHMKLTKRFLLDGWF